MRSSSFNGGFNQQGYRPRGPTGTPQWGPRGHNQQMPYDYHHGPYPSQSSHYQQSNYGGYPSQMPPRSGFGPGWEQRPPHGMHGPQSSGYDYYARPGAGAHSTSGHAPGPSPATAMGPPASQSNYYGHPRGPDYMHQPPYAPGGPQHYGHGYEEQKYDNHAPVPNPYGAHGASQQGFAGSQPGYGQQQYGKPAPYGMTSQGPPVQPYGPPATSHPGEVPPYQGPTAATQSYGTHAPPPQQYPYASGAPMQQSYPPYAAAAPTDGYGQQPSASVPAYPQQGSQQVPNYSQPTGQQAPGYVQAAPASGYASYPSQGYAEQPTSNSASYGYQGAPDPSYSGAPAAYTAPAGQPAYPQPAAAQPAYDQSYQQSGGYAATQGAAPVTYG